MAELINSTHHGRCQKIDVNPEEAAPSLGAPDWAITKDILFAAG